MRVWKRAGALLAAGALLLGLTACGSSITDDATVYVQGLLDANYKGEISQDYIDVVEDMTQEQAQADHENNLEIEAGYLLSFLAVELPTDAVTQRAQEIVDEIYSHAQYTVADAEQLSSGDIAVEVTVSPIEIIPLLTEDQMAAAWTSVKQASGASDEAIAAMSDEEYQVLDEQYANALLDQLEALIPQLTYGQDQVIMLQMKEIRRLLLPGGLGHAEAGRGYDRLLWLLCMTICSRFPAAAAAGIFY